MSWTKGDSVGLVSAGLGIVVLGLTLVYPVVPVGLIGILAVPGAVMVGLPILFFFWVRCPHCKCYFTLEKTDATSGLQRDRELKFTCSACGHEFWRQEWNAGDD